MAMTISSSLNLRILQRAPTSVACYHTWTAQAIEYNQNFPYQAAPLLSAVKRLEISGNHTFSLLGLLTIPAYSFSLPALLPALPASACIGCSLFPIFPANACKSPPECLTPEAVAIHLKTGSRHQYSPSQIFHQQHSVNLLFNSPGFIFIPEQTVNLLFPLPGSPKKRNAKGSPPYTLPPCHRPDPTMFPLFSRSAEVQIETIKNRLCRYILFMYFLPFS